jgi:hypothetical protein
MVQTELLQGSDIDFTTSPGPNGEPPYHLTGQLGMCDDFSMPFSQQIFYAVFCCAAVLVAIVWFNDHHLSLSCRNHSSELLWHGIASPNSSYAFSLAVSIAQEKPEGEGEQEAGGAPVSAIGQEPIQYPQPVVQHVVQIQPQPAAVTVSGPLDNLLKSLTADIAQDNLAIDALRTQVQKYFLCDTSVPSTREQSRAWMLFIRIGLSVDYVVMIMWCTMHLSRVWVRMCLKMSRYIQYHTWSTKNTYASCACMR